MASAAPARCWSTVRRSIPVWRWRSDDITTVEGLAGDAELSELQKAFLQHDAYQCGYCTPGQLTSATERLSNQYIGSSDTDVAEAMSGNICRCGAYKNILAAIQQTRANA